ncbi:MAG: phosphoesterase [Chloroflexi bacterium]|nr:MAG: phosphoesterase [Chloroflexota bacterium]
MSRSFRRVLTFAIGFVTAIAAGPALASVEAGNQQSGLSGINHMVVIYEENHSFDNLYGLWEGVNGLANADPARTTQVAQDGTPYACLKQNDVNLTTPPLLAGCSTTSNFHNEPFLINTYIQPTDTTCPQPGQEFAKPTGWTKETGITGGCTRDIVHRFYQEQYQLHGGAQNLYVTGSDAVGLAMGYYDTTALPIYTYLHSDGHPHYAIADDFFQSAFGGSFLNHQWLIAAASPVWTDAPAEQHSIIDSNGMPNKYALYNPTGPVLDRAVTQVCPSVVAHRACGDFAVNTIQPFQQPFRGQPQLPKQYGATIGDELTGAGVSWGWYSGGWSNANGDVGAPGWTNTDLAKPGTCGDLNSVANPTYPYCPSKVFQYHHQPFNYYAAYRPNTVGRTHLRDEAEFMQLANSSSKTCNLNSVSFVKPVGLENEHPGYTSETRGSSHLVDLLSAINNSACRKDTMVVVTYDEFGGQWDHVAPPGQGNANGPHDDWGPGTRIPTLVIAPRLRGEFVVDHTQYDTTSILATIEHRYGLSALGTRDAAVNDLSSVFNAHSPFDT